MENNTLTDLFNDLRDDFNLEEPTIGHQQRFVEKLTANKIVEKKQSRIYTLWRPILGIAASLAIVVTLALGLQNSSESNDLASVSPEMATTQAFFKTTLMTELEKLKVEESESPEFQKIIVDALFQIEILEQDYQKLKKDLEKSGNDKRVIHAMVSNYQNRIQILQDVLTNIDKLKQNNDNYNESNTTI